MQRPTGITILAVLSFLGGILLLFAALGMFTLGSVAVSLGADAGAVSGLTTILGVVTLIVALLDLAFAIGAWGLKPWAWILGIIGQGVNLILIVVNVLQGSPISGQIVSIVISAIIIYYLMTPDIKRVFGRA
jgi:hypothetical protein